MAKTFVIGLTLFIAFYTQTRSFEQRHARDVAANPSDIRFVLRTKDGQDTFYPGEAIPLELEFSSSVPNKYRLDGATYDRSGRLHTEEFVFDREDVVDPFQDYFGTGVMGGLAGGLRVDPILETRPYRIELFLNDWCRFDKPGRYRLYLRSHRLRRERLPGEPGDGRVIEFAPVSNVLNIRISAPDRAWEDRKLRELAAVFESQGESPEGQSEYARRQLRYLGTPTAVRFILSRARQNPEELDYFALIGSPHRHLVIDELDQFVEATDTVISPSVVRLRTLLDYVRKSSPRRLPIYMWEIPEADREIFLAAIGAEVDARQKEYERMVKERSIAYMRLIGRKSEAVRDQTARSIAELVPDEAKAAGLVEPEDFGLSREQLIASFELLAEERQWALLTKKWGLVRGPEMLPVLRRIVGRASSGLMPASALGYSLWHGPTRTDESALERLFEVSPEEGRQIVLRDVAMSKPRFAYFAVNKLPAQDVRDADTVFAENLKTNPSGTIPLIAKFGTNAISSLVRSIYLKKNWPCEEERWFIAYFIRVLPPDEARLILAQALSLRTERGCFRDLFTRVGSVIWNSGIEEEAIAKLNDPDSEVAANASSALAKYGTKNVEPLLWGRLEQWSSEWRGRAEELVSNPITHPGTNPEERLGNALFESIAQARAWHLDEARRQRLLSLCLDEECRRRWMDHSGSVN